MSAVGVGAAADEQSAQFAVPDGQYDEVDGDRDRGEGVGVVGGEEGLFVGVGGHPAIVLNLSCVETQYES